MASARGRFGNAPPTNRELHTELYARLHVSRDASDDEVKAAYRKLATAYHPDKFNTEQMRDVAKENFQKIRQAYDVLSNPLQRQIYDIYGPEGVASGLEVGSKLDNANEIEVELERQKMRARERRRAAHVNHAGAVINNISLYPPLGRPMMNGQLSPLMAATSSSVVNLMDGTFTLNNTWHRQLSATTGANLSMSVGGETSVGVGWNRQLEHGQLAGDIKLGGGMSGAAGSYTHRLTESVTTKLAAKISMRGVDLELGASQRLSNHSSAGCAWVVNSAVCVDRLFRPFTLFSWLSVPTLTYACIKCFILSPHAIRRAKRRQLEQRRKTAAQVAKSRESALHSQLLQSSTAQRKATEAGANGGLEITGALYGNLRPDRGEEEGLPPPYLDVKVPMQFMVEGVGGRGAVELHKGVQKCGLMGFCDPCPGEDKMLRVMYRFKGNEYKAVVGDFEELRIPEEKHRIYGGPTSVHEVD